MTAKTLTPPFTPSDALLNSGRLIKGNEVTVIEKPWYIDFTEINVPAVAMENTQKKDVVIGKIENYANFVETNVAIKTQVSGISGVKASIASDGTVTVNLDRPAPGDYEVGTILTAPKCEAVVTEDFNLTVTAPVEKKMAVETATIPSMTTYKKKPVFILNYADKNVTFSVPGYTVAKWTSSNTSYLKFGANGVASLRKASSSARFTVSALLSDGSTVKHYVMIRKIAPTVVLQYKLKKSAKWKAFGNDPITVQVGAKPYVRTVAPKGTTIFASAKWKSADPAIAYVKSGRLICKAAGLTSFEYVLDNGFVATVWVNVVPKGSKGIPVTTPVSEPSVEPTLEPEPSMEPEPTLEPEQAPSEAPASVPEQIDVVEEAAAIE